MENLLQLLASGMGLHTKPARLKRYLIGNTGCSTLLFTADTTLHVKFTAHGDKIFFNEQLMGGAFGMICIQLKEPIAKGEIKKLLCSYMQAMQQPLGIKHTLLPRMQKAGNAFRVTNTWQDSQGRDWDVKGYGNHEVLAILYVKDIGRVKVADAEAFVSAFKFA